MKRVHRIEEELLTGTVDGLINAERVWVQWDADVDGTAGSRTVEWIEDLVEV